MTTQIDTDLLSTICELIQFCGAQTLSQIVHDVIMQCVGYDNVEDTTIAVRRHLDYLVKLRTLKCEDDNEYPVWGYASDF